MDKANIEKIILKYILLKKEEKKHFYTPNYNIKNTFYIFEDEKDFNNYFKMYGLYLSEELLDVCKYKTLSNGNIIAFKNKCDYTIQRYLTTTLDERINSLKEKLTPKKIEEIHSRGNITFLEKVEEWESMDLCAPGDAIGSATYRCNTFHDCHKCLLDLASHQLEHSKFEFKPLLSHLYIEDDKNVKKLKLTNTD